jgi:hypothetical protein
MHPAVPGREALGTSLRSNRVDRLQTDDVFACDGHVSRLRRACTPPSWSPRSMPAFRSSWIRCSNTAALRFAPLLSVTAMYRAGGASAGRRVAAGSRGSVPKLWPRSATTAAVRNTAVGETFSRGAPNTGAIARPIHQESPVDAMYLPRRSAGARSATSGISKVVWKHSPTPTRIAATNKVGCASGCRIDLGWFQQPHVVVVP